MSAEISDFQSKPVIPRRQARHQRAPGQRLRSAVQALAGGHALIAAHSESNWASITFAGTRHRLELHFSGDHAIAAGELLLDALPEHEFNIPGHLVADASVIEVDHRVSMDPLVPSPFMQVCVELLLLEEC